MFQSTPSRGGRLAEHPIDVTAAKFQSTPSRGGRLRCSYQKSENKEFQSTPSRGGRPNMLYFQFAVLDVSIHALTRRATFPKKAKLGQCCVSIHALTRRATFTNSNSKGTALFQSTPSRGGRLQSFHASWIFTLFQSTPSRGGRRQKLFR